MTKLARLRRVIAGVPRGKVITYGQVALAAGYPGAARLTVWALHTAGKLPWHRVVAAGGRIALEGDEGREQRLRLTIEGVAFRGNHVRMDLHDWIPNVRPRPREPFALPVPRETLARRVRGRPRSPPDGTVRSFGSGIDSDGSESPEPRDTLSAHPTRGRSSRSS